MEKLPLTLSYVANLEPGERAVLFYDNLVAAAEYFSAYIEAGMKRRESTCVTGMDSARYKAVFEQVGISVAELENCGYLSNLSADGLNHNRDYPNDYASQRNGDRFIHVQGLPDEPKLSLRNLLEIDRRVHSLSATPASSICCFDARLVLDDASNGFKELLKAHQHCFFQGVAVPTDKLLEIQRSEAYPRFPSA